MEGRSIGNAGGGEARRPGASAEAAVAAHGDVLWYVAHTRPRCEKKLATQCGRWGVAVTLPLYASVKKYRGKTVTFQKPLFAGYVFLRFQEALRSRVLQSEHLANLLTVPAQDEFQAQLQAIQKALETSYDVRLCPSIEPGSRVRVRSGPLRGLEGHVELRRGMVEVHLRLDFIGQAAAVTIDADLLELV